MVSRRWIQDESHYPPLAFYPEIVKLAYIAMRGLSADEDAINQVVEARFEFTDLVNPYGQEIPLTE